MTKIKVLIKHENNYEPYVGKDKVLYDTQKDYLIFQHETKQYILPIQYSPTQIALSALLENKINTKKIIDYVEYNLGINPLKKQKNTKLEDLKQYVKSNAYDDIKNELHLQEYKKEKLILIIDSISQEVEVYSKYIDEILSVKTISKNNRDSIIQLLTQHTGHSAKEVENLIYYRIRNMDEYVTVIYDFIHDCCSKNRKYAISQLAQDKILQKRSSFDSANKQMKQQHDYLLNPGVMVSNPSPCRYCEAYKVITYVFQSRSCDEGQTELNKCQACGKQWAN